MNKTSQQDKRTDKNAQTQTSERNSMADLPTAARHTRTCTAILMLVASSLRGITCVVHPTPSAVDRARGSRVGAGHSAGRASQRIGAPTALKIEWRTGARVTSSSVGGASGCGHRRQRGQQREDRQQQRRRGGAHDAGGKERWSVTIQNKHPSVSVVFELPVVFVASPLEQPPCAERAACGTRPQKPRTHGMESSRLLGSLVWPHTPAFAPCLRGRASVKTVLHSSDESARDCPRGHRPDTVRPGHRSSLARGGVVAAPLFPAATDACEFAHHTWGQQQMQTMRTSQWRRDASSHGRRGRMLLVRRVQREPAWSQRDAITQSVH